MRLFDLGLFMFLFYEIDKVNFNFLGWKVMIIITLILGFYIEVIKPKFIKEKSKEATK